jgi:hypothetical protein
MSIQLYKILHFAGLTLAFMGLTGVLALRWSSSETLGKRLLFSLSHGLGMLVALVSGFGLAAKLGYTSSLPYWIIGLIIVWILLGASFALVKRLSKFSALIMIWLTVLAIIGSWLAVMKPFQE